MYHITSNIKCVFLHISFHWKIEMSLKFKDCAPFQFFPKTHIQNWMCLKFKDIQSNKVFKFEVQNKIYDCLAT